MSLSEVIAEKAKVATMEKDGIIFQACIACAKMYGVTNDLKTCLVDVKGMGTPLTKDLKQGIR